ncbi:hypothetical protein [Kitasatospora sp. MAP5-34]|uniref:hypothetical protein n=1 Tax=Kitasatospora sp. MAP5-34 TaxID=3035102 RepID=UPI0024761E4E|nr:hypothetical protein [Kitasatospora sp. MAP5-34]MDH6576227.1 hypothetical protein [Kitasatospora sp. MAP5-34]
MTDDRHADETPNVTAREVATEREVAAARQVMAEHKIVAEREAMAEREVAMEYEVRAEREVRAMLHRAVAQVQPDPGALPRLQRAVPRRRARHRNVWTGSVAAVLLAVAAVPTIRGVGPVGLSDSPTDGRVISDTGGPGAAVIGGARSSGRPHVPGPAGTGSGAAGVGIGVATSGIPAGSASAAFGGGPEALPAGGSTGAAALPSCARADLGQGGSYLAAADGSGKIYGWFTVLNISGRSCSLTGAGTVRISAVSGTDPGWVKVVDHQTGDPAGGLPDPGSVPRSLVLQPLAGYQVQFGWVPDAPCPTSSNALRVAAPGPTGTGAPWSSPAPGPVSGSGGGSGGGGAGGVRAADLGGPGTATPDPGAAGGTGTPVPNLSASPSPSTGPTVSPSPTGATPSITLVHTPQAGAPAAATAVVNGACAGTVYRAAPQALPAAAPAGTPTTGG